MSSLFLFHNCLNFVIIGLRKLPIKIILMHDSCYNENESYYHNMSSPLPIKTTWLFHNSGSWNLFINIKFISCNKPLIYKGEFAVYSMSWDEFCGVIGAHVGTVWCAGDLKSTDTDKTVVCCVGLVRFTTIHLRGYIRYDTCALLKI
jgi:hypothetical protein